MQRLPTDGTVVSQHPVEVHPEYRDLVQIDRILYLVDGLKVVGFIAKPITCRLCGTRVCRACHAIQRQ